MPSFADSIFLFVLALLLFGPKKLPVLARELGKWMGEFRRASNEFKMQMEEELRASEQSERQKQIVAMEAAAPVPPPLTESAEPEHPHLRYTMTDPAAEPSMLSPQPSPEPAPDRYARPGAETQAASDSDSAADTSEPEIPVSSPPSTADGARPIPIATSGSLKMMPPATGLPTPRASRSNPLSGLVDAVPEASAGGTGSLSAPDTESVVHGD